MRFPERFFCRAGRGFSVLSVSPFDCMLDGMQDWGGVRGSFEPCNFSPFSKFTFGLKDIDCGEHVNYEPALFLF